MVPVSAVFTKNIWVSPRFETSGEEIYLRITISASEASFEMISELSKSPRTIFTFGKRRSNSGGELRSRTVISYDGCFLTSLVKTLPPM